MRQSVIGPHIDDRQVIAESTCRSNSIRYLILTSDRQANVTRMIFKNPNTQEYWFEEGLFVKELMNSPENDRVSVARCRLPAGKQTRWHSLTVTEWYLILEGQGRLELGSAPPIQVSADDCVEIAPGESQRIKNIGDTDLIFQSVCMPRFTPQSFSLLET